MLLVDILRGENCEWGVGGRLGGGNGMAGLLKGVCLGLD